MDAKAEALAYLRRWDFAEALVGSVADSWEGPGLKPLFLLGWVFRGVNAPVPSGFVLRTKQVRFGAGFGGSHPFVSARKDRDPSLDRGPVFRIWRRQRRLCSYSDS